MMSKKGATKIENVQTDKLIPYARNARKHSEAQVAQIAASIREFGFNSPVLIDDSNTIIAGHGRVLAARKLGLEAVPCVRLSDLSDAERRAYTLVDNRLAESSEWDSDLLKLELEEIEALDIDISPFGFDEIKEANDEEDERKPKEKEPKIESEFLLVLTLASESEQQALWDELQQRGIDVRIP